ncbi:MAG TPA: hypothetical protein VFA84_04895 [Acidimicrobiales bacterium]|nr:hypothetical protein [Acidimicrobiales bacterium]
MDVDVVVDDDVDVVDELVVDDEVDEDVVDDAAFFLLPLLVSTSRMIRITNATPRPITTPSRTRLSGPRGGRGRPGG